MPKRKDKEQSAKASLGADPDYTGARTLLAQEQTERIRQIRRKEEGELIEAEEVRRVLVGAGQSLNVRLRGIEKRLRSSFPEVKPEVLEFIAKSHEEALGLLSADLLRRAA